jgi:DUF1680 family protein
MDMPVQAVFANPAVRQLEGRLAIQRGPLIYCLESADHGDLVLDQISINPQNIANFTATHRSDLLGGVTVIEGQGKVIDEKTWEGGLYNSRPAREKDIAITAIPYFAWDNRTPGEMRVWLRSG